MGHNSQIGSLQVRAEQFRFFAEALKSAKLKVYVPYFVQEAQASPASHAIGLSPLRFSEAPWQAPVHVTCMAS